MLLVSGCRIAHDADYLGLGAAVSLAVLNSLAEQLNPGMHNMAPPTNHEGINVAAMDLTRRLYPPPAIRLSYFSRTWRTPVCHRAEALPRLLLCELAVLSSFSKPPSW